MGLISLLLHNPLAFFILTIPLLYSIILHEIAHGWVAYLFGDTTAKESGRLSLNPAAHLDPIGTVALFLVGFGWAKPVPIDYSNIKNFRIGLICISLAGCLMNIFIATLALLILHLPAIATIPMLASILIITAKINIMLGAFNLIPIPPLDGSRIVLGLLPQRAQVAFARLEPYGLILLFGLLFTGALNPVIMFIQKVIMTFIGFILKI